MFRPRESGLRRPRHSPSHHPPQALHLPQVRHHCSDVTFNHVKDCIHAPSERRIEGHGDCSCAGWQQGRKSNVIIPRCMTRLSLRQPNWNRNGVSPLLSCTLHHTTQEGGGRGGGRRGQDCAQPRTTTKHIATSDLQKQRGRVSECHRLHSVPVTERPCGRRLLVPDGAPSIDALPCGFKKNNEEEKEGPRAPKPVSPISRRLKTGTREIPNQKRKNVAACRLAVGSPSLRSVLLWDRSD